MMEYNNPNSPWMHTGYDPYYENMSDDDRVKSGCMQVIIYFVAIIVADTISCV